MNMNKLNNTQKAKRNIVKSLATLCLGLLSIGFTACDDDLDVTQAGRSIPSAISNTTGKAR